MFLTVTSLKVKIEHIAMLLFAFTFLTGCGEGLPLAGKSVPKFVEEDYANADVNRGGLLYDKWWVAKNESAPAGEHPIWSARADQLITKEESDTFRCKTCHGWDYKGANGENAQGTNDYTGFPGIFERRINGNTLEEQSAQDVFEFIAAGKAGNFGNKDHGFKKYLDTADLYDLTAFVKNVAFKGPGNILGGSPVKGQAVYANAGEKSCASSSCHGTNGKAIDFDDGNATTPGNKFLGDLAQSDPSEFIHKSRFGTPDGRMPGDRTILEAIDVLAYVRGVLGTPSGGGNTGDFNPALYEAADLVKGGLIYDKWWEVTAQTTVPAGNHNYWPDTNTQISGESTWRCKQCHGWDYRGKNGLNASGKNSSGIIGVVGQGISKLTPTQIYNFLTTNADHGFDSILTSDEAYAATKFVMTMRNEASTGKSSVDYIVSYDNKYVKPGVADLTNGKNLFLGLNSSRNLCATCHGVDGKEIDFADGDPTTPPDEFVHNIAQENPWEFIHKVRFGDVTDTETMPALLNETVAAYKDIKAAVDILAFAQTQLVVDSSRAGRLWDNWIVETSASKTTNPEITKTHPLWLVTQNTQQTNETTWRCKSCHGWDYQGVNGTYGQTASPYYTGIKGVIPFLLRSGREKVFDFIKNGDLSRPQHAFAKYLSDEDIGLLADFIADPIEKKVRKFDAEIANANATRGAAIYKSTSPGGCEACHGSKGDRFPKAILGDVARSNVPEFIHKTRFGQPGSEMIPTASGFAGLDPQQAADVVLYAKSLAAGGGTPNPTPTPTPTPTPGGSYDKASVSIGGRLYDAWWKELGLSAPTSVNPLWDAAFNQIPDFTDPAKRITDSWRCKSCHAWNYKGKGFSTGSPGLAGAGDNLYYKLTDIIETQPGTLAEKQQSVFNYIKNGVAGWHDFGATQAGIPRALGDQEIWHLTKFFFEGVINTDDYIYDIFGEARYPDVTNGKGLYSGSVDTNINCASCHGADGKGIAGKGTDTVDIIQLSVDDPAEVLHKIRFGQPDTTMPAFLGDTAAHTTAHARDVLGYMQVEQRNRVTPALQ